MPYPLAKLRRLDARVRLAVTQPELARLADGGGRGRDQREKQRQRERESAAGHHQGWRPVRPVRGRQQNVTPPRRASRVARVFNDI